MKRFLILMLFLIGTAIFSETLESTNYSNGILSGTFRENRQVNIEALKGRSPSGEVLIMTLKNVRNNAPAISAVADDFIEKVIVSEQPDDVKIYVYLKSGTDYAVYNSRKSFQVQFSNPSASAKGKNTVRTEGREGRNEDKQGRDTRRTDTGTVGTKTGILKKGNYTIVIDAGHGGHDSGAVANGYREKDLALQVSLKLEKELGKDYNIIMTRRTDIFKTLQERPEMGNNKYADLFVSIHLNSATSPSANGTEVFYYTKKDAGNYGSDIAKFQNNLDSSISMSDYVLRDINYRMNQHRSSSLATDVLNNLLNNFAVRDRGVKSENFAVLRGSNSPAILIELGFVSNYSDVSQFVSDYDQERAARSIADAIRRHFIK